MTRTGPNLTPPTQPAASPEKLLTQAEVAERLSVSERTLEAWRCRGFGPAFVKLGRSVRYRPSDVERWLAAHVRAD